MAFGDISTSLNKAKKKENYLNSFSSQNEQFSSSSAFGQSRMLSHLVFRIEEERKMKTISFVKKPVKS